MSLEAQGTELLQTVSGWSLQLEFTADCHRFSPDTEYGNISHPALFFLFFFLLQIQISASFSRWLRSKAKGDNEIQQSPEQPRRGKSCFICLGNQWFAIDWGSCAPKQASWLGSISFSENRLLPMQAPMHTRTHAHAHAYHIHTSLHQLQGSQNHRQENDLIIIIITQSMGKKHMAFKSFFKCSSTDQNGTRNKVKSSRNLPANEYTRHALK